MPSTPLLAGFSFPGWYLYAFLGPRVCDKPVLQEFWGLHRRYRFEVLCSLPWLMDAGLSEDSKLESFVPWHPEDMTFLLPQCWGRAG